LDVGEGRDTDLEVGRVCEWRGEEEEEEEDVGRIRYGFMRDESMTTTNFPSKAPFLFWK
jgi:hypothetical protein